MPGWGECALRRSLTQLQRRHAVVLELCGTFFIDAFGLARAQGTLAFSGVVAQPCMHGVVIDQNLPGAAGRLR